MIVEGLVRSGSKEARSLAKDIAIRWIRTNYATYKTSKAMHEKYDVSKCGDFGRGGEYVPQVSISKHYFLWQFFGFSSTGSVFGLGFDLGHCVLVLIFLFLMKMLLCRLVLDGLMELC